MFAYTCLHTNKHTYKYTNHLSSLSSCSLLVLSLLFPFSICLAASQNMHVFVRIHAHMSVRACILVHAYISMIRTDMSPRVHFLPLLICKFHIHVLAHKYVQIRKNVHTCVCLYLRKYVQAHTSMYTRLDLINRRLNRFFTRVCND